MRHRKNSGRILKFKMLVILFCVFIIFFIIKGTLSKYQSQASAKGSLSTAMFIVDEGFQSMNLNLNSIVPRDKPYEYEFVIANTDGTNRAEVNLEYELKIVTTTNLPLDYELYLNGGKINIITDTKIELDEHSTYFKTMLTEKKQFGFTKDESNTYKLVVYFPSIYKDIIYQDIIEGIEIQVNSSQIIE